MATIDDLLTTQKNGVIAINNINQTTEYLSGKTTSATVATQTVIATGSGRLVNISVIVAGTTVGKANNAQIVANITTGNAIVTIPNTIGVYQCGCNFTNGLIITPGTGQSVNVTYSLS